MDELGKERWRFALASNAVFAQYNVDEDAFHPIMLFPAGRSDEMILFFASGMGAKQTPEYEPAWYVALLKRDGATTQRVWLARLVMRRKGVDRDPRSLLGRRVPALRGSSRILRVAASEKGSPVAGLAGGGRVRLL